MKPVSLRRTVILATMAGVSTFAIAQTRPTPSPSPPARPLTIEQLQSAKAFDDVSEAIDKAGALLESMGRKRETACKLAFGDASFCSCLTESLPAIVSFDNYIHIVTSTKDELGYSKLSAGDKGLVDATRSARESCVGKAHAAHPK